MKIDLQHIENVYFLGIGGIGMSALARYFKHLGKSVAGYDLTKTSLTETLSSEGMNICYDESETLIPKHLTKENTLVVYTPAVPREHNGYQWFRKNGFAVFKRAHVLGMLCNSVKSIAVAGTHGKTTVSSMAAVILNESSLGCGAFLGGILKNYNSNLILPENEQNWIVTEADEYDRSFLNLFPDLALITAIDPDHLDIYGTHEAMKKSFGDFAGQVKNDGCLILKKGLELEVSDYQKIRFYSLDKKADYYAENIHPSNNGYCFDLISPIGKIEGIELNFPGIINVENAVAASAIAIEAGVQLNEVKRGVALYQGVRRRFDVRFRSEDLLFIDDYAHHPRELEAVISSVKKLYPAKMVTGIFQPHLFTRTRDFADGFAKSLDMLDQAVIIPIYPAREKPIEGVTSEMIIQKMKNKNTRFMEMNEVVPWVLNNKSEIIMTLGAGSIDRVADKLAFELKKIYA